MASLAPAGQRDRSKTSHQASPTLARPCSTAPGLGGGAAGFDRLGDLLEVGTLALSAELFHHAAGVIEIGSTGQFQAVASAIDRLDETGLTGIGLELGAQMADVNANGLDVVIGLIAPDLFEDQ